MKQKLVIGLLFGAARICAQDRFYYSNDSVSTGQLVKIAGDSVYYHDEGNAALYVVDKNYLYLIETANGKRYLFAKPKPTVSQHHVASTKRHSLGLQPVDILLGRATVVYEQLSADGKIGFAFPLSLTFDPLRRIYGVSDSISALNPVANRIGWIAGADLNFYSDRPLRGFFIGPRFRLGTDIFLGGMEGYTLQTQVGLRNQSSFGLLQHISFGFGLARILEGPLPYGFNAKFIPWYSINYRISLAW